MKQIEHCNDDKILRTIRLGSVVMLLGSFLRVFLFNDNDWFVALVVAIMCIAGLPTKATTNEDND